MKDKQQHQNKFAYNTFKNASISIILSLLVITFNLVRTGLTSATFGLDSLGLLALAISILPYISGGHNSFFNVATAKLYKSIHLKQYHEANKKISDLKPQFYMFGFFYLTITVVLAFAFPFLAAGHTGTIVVREEHGSYSIQWWQSTLFILSNTIELLTTYFIIPISMILMFINNKSYIYNSYNILITVLSNAIIITLFVLQMNHIINISFIWMNTIIILLLGSKVLFVLLILYPYRKKHFSWFQKQRASSWKICKETWQSVGTTYLDQFSTDVITILFLVYSAVKTSSSATFGISIELQHGTGGSGFAPDGFVPASIYFVFMTLLTSGHDIMHSIIDAAIPSLAEHATHNDAKINKHFFHRFQMLNIFIASFTATNFILTAPLLNSVLMFHNHHSHENLMDPVTLNIMIGLLWVPTLIDVFTSMHKHILSMFGEFKKTLIISVIKAAILTILFLIFGAIIFTSVNEAQWTYAIYGTIIGCSVIANLTSYALSRKSVEGRIAAADGCVHLVSTSLLSFVWLGLSIIFMLSLTITHANAFIDLTHNKTNIGPVIGASLGIGLCNMVINIFNMYWCRKTDFRYYVQEIKHNIKIERKNSAN